MPPEPRARVVSAAPAPPREVEYRDDFEDDRPTVRRVRKRGTLPSLIIYAFVGGMMGATAYSIPTFIQTAKNIGYTFNLNDPRLDDIVMRCFIVSIPAFFVGGCFGAFIWAVTKSSR